MANPDKEAPREDEAAEAARTAQANAEAEFKKLIETPFSTPGEMKAALADNDIQRAQLRVIRMRKVDELNQIDHQLELAELDRAIIVRRSLNASGEAK